MQLEKQVVSLELAKKLKELGFKQESLFYWHSNCGEDFLVSYKSVKREYPNTFNHSISAYTVAELGEMLPISSDIPSKISENEWHYFEKQSFGIKDCIYQTEADARAKMLICLKENKLI